MAEKATGLIVELVAEGLNHEKDEKGDTYRVAVPTEWVTVKAKSAKEAEEKALAIINKKFGTVLKPDNMKVVVKGSVA